jgi:hypothetical protein
LVLITNSKLDFHIRTQTTASGWSGIVEAAIKIDNDILVVKEPSGSIFVNGLPAPPPPFLFAGYIFSVLPVSPVRFRLDLGGGQYIDLTRAYANTLQVDVLGDGIDFGDSQGLCANWTADSPNALRGRNNQVFPLINPNIPYGEEWRVDSTIGDPVLFQPPSVAKCNYTQLACNGVQLVADQRCIARGVKAKNACINVPTERNAQKNCEFDVIQTDDASIANTTAYTAPLIGNPPERCVEVVTSNPNVTSCGKRGGRCAWRCDQSLFNCVGGLCRGLDQGCLCALPKDIVAPTKAPVNVTAPAPVPVKAPAVPAPVPVPVPVPIPVPMTVPVTVPVPAPVPVPVPVTAPLNPTSRAYCRVYPDPHFNTVRKKVEGCFI